MRTRSARLSSLPPFIFADIDRKRRAKVATGADVINLGIGDPDRPTPRFIIEAMQAAVAKPENHPYAYGGGTKPFREAAARFMERRWGVRCDPQKHILACIGSKEGLAHLPIAVADPGDGVCVPACHYPVYSTTAAFSGLRVHFMPMTEANGWVPDLEAIPADVRAAARMVITNHPNNPTGSCVGVDFYEKQVRYCAAHGLIAVSDQAYSEIYFEEKPPSLWQAPSANLDTTFAIEFHSLSKTFNMTGWRCAFAIGHPEIIAALASVKSHYDSGCFAAVQEAGAHALDHYDHPDVAGIRSVYLERREALLPGLRAIGCRVDPPKAGFFCWAKCPPGWKSAAFADRALGEAAVVVVPGSGFSPSADEYFRIALTVETPRLLEACERLARLKW
jgi:LL-diaminopimelate aminotransferase